MKKALTSVLLLAAFTLFAQKGSVKGYIYDKANGEGVAFATVKIEGTDVGAATDEQGFFNIPNLAVGPYKVVVSYIG
ncbi:MAG: carboxypeptidase-like regulatory domain-containing protein, partial [Bacteroidota bacterium]